MIKHFFTRQFLAFLSVGGTAAFLNWSARIVLSWWFPFAWAVAVAYAIGMSTAFILNSLIVFPRSEKPRHKQARDFTVVNLGFFPVVWSASIMIYHGFLATGMTFYPEAIAHGIAVSIPMLATFLLYKFFAFKDIQVGQP